MFPVFVTLWMILKGVSRCHCHIEKQPRNICREFMKLETEFSDFLVSFNGVRYSVYLEFKEELISVSFYHASIFGRMVLYHTSFLPEFRLVQSQIDTEDFAANSPYFLLELIRPIPAGAKRHPVGTYPRVDNLFIKFVFPLIVCAFSFTFSQHPAAIPLPDRFSR